MTFNFVNKNMQNIYNQMFSPLLNVDPHAIMTHTSGSTGSQTYPYYLLNGNAYAANAISQGFPAPFSQHYMNTVNIGNHNNTAVGKTTSFNTNIINNYDSIINYSGTIETINNPTPLNIKPPETVNSNEIFATLNNANNELSQNSSVINSIINYNGITETVNNANPLNIKPPETVNSNETYTTLNNTNNESSQNSSVINSIKDQKDKNNYNQSLFEYFESSKCENNKCMLKLVLHYVKDYEELNKNIRSILRYLEKSKDNSHYKASISLLKETLNEIKELSNDKNSDELNFSEELLIKILNNFNEKSKLFKEGEHSENNTEEKTKENDDENSNKRKNSEENNRSSSKRRKKSDPKNIYLKINPIIIENRNNGILDKNDSNSGINNVIPDKILFYESSNESDDCINAHINTELIKEFNSNINGIKLETYKEKNNKMCNYHWYEIHEEEEIKFSLEKNKQNNDKKYFKLYFMSDEVVVSFFKFEIRTTRRNEKSFEINIKHVFNLYEKINEKEKTLIINILKEITSNQNNSSVKTLEDFNNYIRTNVVKKSTEKKSDQQNNENNIKKVKKEFEEKVNKELAKHYNNLYDRLIDLIKREPNKLTESLREFLSNYSTKKNNLILYKEKDY